MTVSSFFDGFEFDEGTDFTEALASSKDVLALDEVEMKDFYEVSRGNLVRPADGTLWRVDGESIIRVNLATNVVEV